MAAPASPSDEVAVLRAELERVRRERDLLATRVLELEQQASQPSIPVDDSPSIEDSFRVEQSRAKRQRLPLSLALVELDGVQELRDRLGHAAGEDGAAHLGNVLRRCLRPTDVVARVDGPAFAVLLTDTGLESGLAAMKRVLGDMATAAFAAGPTESVLSFSAGLVQWRADEALGDLMTRASRALGLARRGGAGRIVVG